MAASGTKRGTVGRGEERYAKAELIERFGPNAAAPDVREAQAIRRSERRGYGLGHAADGTWRMGIKGALAGGGLPGTGFNGHQEISDTKTVRSRVRCQEHVDRLALTPALHAISVSMLGIKVGFALRAD